MGRPCLRFHGAHRVDRAGVEAAVLGGGGPVEGGALGRGDAVEHGRAGDLDAEPLVAVGALDRTQFDGVGVRAADEGAAQSRSAGGQRALAGRGVRPLRRDPGAWPPNAGAPAPA